MDGDRAGRLSRRELITGAVAVGATAALAADAAGADTPPESEPVLLTKALALERLSVARLYGADSAAGAQRPRAACAAHARTPGPRPRPGAGGRDDGARESPLPPPPSGSAALDQALSAKGMSVTLAGVKTLKQTVQLLLDIEALTQGGYYMIIRDASDPALALRAAQVLANEAQHSTLLTELVSPEITQTVPNWYVTGVT